MFLLIFLSMLARSVFADNVTAFANWQPDTDGGYTYCNYVYGSPNIAGLACGNSSYVKMLAAVPSLAFYGQTLGLLSVGWMNSRTLSTQKDWFTACRPYLVQLYDNLYTDADGPQCPFTYPYQSTLQSCSNGNNLLIRKGFGYCMTEPVCGATVPIAFMQDTSTNSLGKQNVMWYFLQEFISMYSSTFKTVFTCYGFKLVDNTFLNSDTIMSAW